jgi:dihydrofolate reductase
MTISIIVAASLNNCIGKANQLPWHISNDLKYFKKLTTNQCFIMGRHTFDSIGKALPNRVNIVVIGGSRVRPRVITEKIKRS